MATELDKSALSKAQRAAMESNGCGVMYQGLRHFCDHPYLPDGVRQEQCACKVDASAAVAAYLDNQSLRSQAGVSEDEDNNAGKWRENVEHLLSTGDPDVIRCHEGGGPESLIGSLVLTMMRTRNSRDKAMAAPAQEVVAWLPDNLLSHRKSWLDAMGRLIDLEPESSEPDMDEKGYWRHERRAMIDMYADIDARAALQGETK